MTNQDALKDIIPSVQEGLKITYNSKIKPVEKNYKFDKFHSPLLSDSDFDAKPMVLLLGQYSVGKTTFIKYLLGRDFPGQHIGPEPTTDRFIAVHGSSEDRSLNGHAATVMADLPFKGLDRFGSGFLSKFQVAQCSSPLLEDITLIDTPGVLAGEKQRLDRGYSFTEVVKWFAERSDMILLLFDAHKLDISDEFRRTMEALTGQFDKARIVLNKADRINNQQLMRVHGALMWSLGRVIKTPEVARVYVGSFWDEPYQIEDNAALFDMERSDLLGALKGLKKNAAVRRTNELVKRARLAKVHACIIGHMKTSMPKLTGKKKKQDELINNLEDEFYKVQQQYGLPIGDFPPVDKFRSMLQNESDFTSFSKPDEKLMKALDQALTIDIPALLTHFPGEGTADEEGSSASNPFADAEWAITPAEKSKYNQTFLKLSPEGGRVTGAAVAPILKQTALPQDQLMKLWDLCDTEKKGKLDLEEFCVIMRLASDFDPAKGVPTMIPADLVPPSKRNQEKTNPF